jgi:hypothetical protein
MTNDQLLTCCTTKGEYQSFHNNALLSQLEDVYRRVGEKKFELAEIVMRPILAVPGQREEAYLYTPAHFYEEWGDAETGTPSIAVICYEQAIYHFYQTRQLATGSGDGAVIMCHVKRVQKKMKLLVTND